MQKTDRVEVAAKSSEADHLCATVYYDGSCALCSFEIAHYASCSGADRLKFVDVSKPKAHLGNDLTQQDAMGRFYVRRTDGKLVSGARGFAELWGNLPGWRWFALVTRLPGIMLLLEVAYRGFLPLRPILSRIASWIGAKPANQTDPSS